VLNGIGEAELEVIREARAVARAEAWRQGAAPERIVLDLDASVVDAHSDKEGAAPTWKWSFGFHPLLAFLAASREAPAAILRPGNAEDADEERRIVARADAAGATHHFLDTCRELGVRFRSACRSTSRCGRPSWRCPPRPGGRR